MGYPPQGFAKAVDLSGVLGQLALVKANTDTIPAVKTQTDKLAGAAPLQGSVNANWNSGAGTSGEVGADLVTFGAAAAKKKLHSVIVNISALTVGALITIRMYEKVNGVEKKVYPPTPQTFTVGTDANGVWVVNGTVEIYDTVRVEVQSNTPGDDGRAISYTVALEDM